MQIGGVFGISLGLVTVIYARHKELKQEEASSRSSSEVVDKSCSETQADLELASDVDVNVIDRDGDTASIKA